ncbi:hypothetical protein QOT17_009615 [Balamuthia mandrillaris]
MPQGPLRNGQRTHTPASYGHLRARAGPTGAGGKRVGAGGGGARTWFSSAAANQPQQPQQPQQPLQKPKKKKSSAKQTAEQKRSNIFEWLIPEEERPTEPNNNTAKGKRSGVVLSAQQRGSGSVLFQNNMCFAYRQQEVSWKEELAAHRRELERLQLHRLRQEQRAEAKATKQAAVALDKKDQEKGKNVVGESGLVFEITAPPEQSLLWDVKQTPSLDTAPIPVEAVKEIEVSSFHHATKFDIQGDKAMTFHLSKAQASVLASTSASFKLPSSHAKSTNNFAIESGGRGNIFFEPSQETASTVASLTVDLKAIKQNQRNVNFLGEELETSTSSLASSAIKKQTQMGVAAVREDDDKLEEEEREIKKLQLLLSQQFISKDVFQRRKSELEKRMRERLQLNKSIEEERAARERDRRKMMEEWERRDEDERQKRMAEYQRRMGLSILSADENEQKEETPQLSAEERYLIALQNIKDPEVLAHIQNFIQRYHEEEADKKGHKAKLGHKIIRPVSLADLDLPLSSRSGGGGFFHGPSSLHSCLADLLYVLYLSGRSNDEGLRECFNLLPSDLKPTREVLHYIEKISIKNPAMVQPCQRLVVSERKHRTQYQRHVQKHLWNNTGTY